MEHTYAYKITHPTTGNKSYDIHICDRYWTRGNVIWQAVILGYRRKVFYEHFGLTTSFLHMVDIPICPN